MLSEDYRVIPGRPSVIIEVLSGFIAVWVFLFLPQNFHMTIQIPEFSLPVMEHFVTLQGEGAYAGHAATFIRLGGCDVGCVWCDVKESWDADVHPQFSSEKIDKILQPILPEIVVVTGGEPAMHPLEGLVALIQGQGKKAHIETSGAHPLSGVWDWITYSPKKFKKPHQSVADKAHELKVVINHKSDFEFAEFHAKTVNNSCLLYLQPEWSKKEKLLPLIIQYVKDNPQWKLSLQTHKYIDIP